MNLYTSFRSELLKISGRPTLILMVILCFLVPMLMIIVFDSDSPEDLKVLAGDPWNRYFRSGMRPIGLVFLPLFILMTCTLLPQLEYRNNTWKQVFASPQSYSQIYFSKFLIVQFLIIIYLLSYIPLMALSSMIVSAIHPAFRFFDYSLDPVPILSALAKSYVAVLGISAIQFVAGMRSRSFLIPIAIGLSLWFTSCLLLFEYSWEYAHRSPYVYSLLFQLPKYAGKINEYLLSSVVCAILVLSLGYFDFSRRAVKG